MQAGKLDRRIQLQSGIAIPNAIGEKIPTWVTMLSMWASVEYTDTKEKYEAAELVAPNEVIFRTRYNAAITEKMRIIFAGHSYDILHIAEINRKAGLKIIACKKDNSATVAPVSAIVVISSIITNHPENTQAFEITLTGTDTVITKRITQQHHAYMVDIPFDTYVVTQLNVDGFTPVSLTPASLNLSSGNSYASVVTINEIIIIT